MRPLRQRSDRAAVDIPAAPPQLLVSVACASEARAALAGGADWIDLKEPARGALGSVDVDTAQAVATLLPAQERLSAAAGELAEWPTGRGRESLRVPRIELVKLGLAGFAAASHDKAARTELAERAAAAVAAARAAGKQVVLAGYADAARADAPAPEVVRDLCCQLRLPWLLIDTFDKRGGGLLDWLPPRALARLLASCRRAGLHTAVAGRLRCADFAALPAGLVDVVGVRSAACGGDRTGAVSETAVRNLKETLHAAAAAANCPEVARQQVDATRAPASS